MEEILVNRTPRVGDQVAYQTEIMAKGNIHPRLAIVTRIIGRGLKLDDGESITLDHWIRVVEPANEEEETVTKKKQLTCPQCGNDFTRTGSRDIYCPDCRKARLREQKAAYRAKKRAEKKGLAVVPPKPQAPSPKPPEQSEPEPAPKPAQGMAILRNLEQAFGLFMDDMQQASETLDKAQRLLAVLEG